MYEIDNERSAHRHCVGRNRWAGVGRTDPAGGVEIAVVDHFRCCLELLTRTANLLDGELFACTFSLRLTNREDHTFDTPLTTAGYCFLALLVLLRGPDSDAVRSCSELLANSRPAIYLAAQQAIHLPDGCWCWYSDEPNVLIQATNARSELGSWPTEMCVQQPRG